MRTSKPHPRLHPPIKVDVPAWLVDTSVAGTGDTWAFALQRYLALTRGRNVTLLSTTVSNLCSLWTGLQAGDRRFALTGAEELADGVILRHLNSAVEFKYARGIAQASIVVAVCEARFLAGIAIDHEVSKAVRILRDKAMAERFFSDWVELIPDTIFPGFKKLTSYAIETAQTLSEAVCDHGFNKSIVDTEGYQSIEILLEGRDFHKDPAGANRSLWKRFEAVKSALEEEFYKAGQASWLSYTRDMSKARFLYTKLCLQGSDSRVSVPAQGLAPRAAVIASARRARHTTSK